MKIKKKPKRIGCLGLSADPPHVGHQNAAQRVLQKGLVDEVWLIPVFRHPLYKSDLVSWKHRLAMTKLLQDQNIMVCEIEKKLGEASYTARTLRALQERHPEHSFKWIIGSDITGSKGYLRWHDWEKLQHECHFIVVERPGYPLTEGTLPGCFYVLVRLQNNDRQIPTSSTEVRRYIQQGKDVIPLVGEGIARYISEHGLYGPNQRQRRKL